MWQTIFAPSQCPTCLRSDHHPLEVRHQEQDFPIRCSLVEIRVTASRKHMGWREQSPAEHWVFTPLPQSQSSQVSKDLMNTTATLWALCVADVAVSFPTDVYRASSTVLKQNTFKVPPGEMEVLLSTWFGTHPSVWPLNLLPPLPTSWGFKSCTSQFSLKKQVWRGIFLLGKSTPGQAFPVTQTLLSSTLLLPFT